MIWMVCTSQVFADDDDDDRYSLVHCKYSDDNVDAAKNDFFLTVYK